MNNHSPSRTTSHSSLRKISIALGLACSLFAGVSQAQVIVSDPSSETSNAASVAKQIDQYIMQGQQYAQQVQQYEQMLTSVTSLNLNVSLMPNQLTQITDTSDLINQACNSGSGSNILGDVLNSVSSMFSQSTTQAQAQICSQVITLQVDEYNQTVIMLGQLQNFNSSLQTLNNLANSFSNMGESSSTTTKAATYASQLNTQMGDWQGRINADDQAIKSLNQMQSVLSQKAMHANPNLVGQATQAAALTTAFAL